MFKEELIEKIDEAVKIESENGKELYGEKFKNWFEVYGALICEVEEVKYEQRHMDETMGRYLFKMRWHDMNKLESDISDIKKFALNLACEAIQVACICNKALESNLEVE